MARTVFLMRWAAVLALVSCVAGCGGKSYPVKGQVTLDGKPMVGGGAIVFLPLDKGQDAGGEIDAQGNYTISTTDLGAGAAAGEYRVLVIQAGPKDGEPTPDGQAPAKVASGVAEKDRIPAVYSDPQHSPLRATVEAKGLNEITIKLERGAVAPNTKPPGA